MASREAHAQQATKTAAIVVYGVADIVVVATVVVVADAAA